MTYDLSSYYLFILFLMCHRIILLSVTFCSIYYIQFAIDNNRKEEIFSLRNSNESIILPFMKESYEIWKVMDENLIGSNSPIFTTFRINLWKVPTYHYLIICPIYVRMAINMVCICNEVYKRYVISSIMQTINWIGILVLENNWSTLCPGLMREKSCFSLHVRSRYSNLLIKFLKVNHYYM